MEQLIGVGWLRKGRTRIGPVSYIVKVYEVRPSRGQHVLAGTEVSTWLHHHAVAPYPWQGQLLTLSIADKRTITGILSEDGAQLVRTGALT